MLSEQGDLLATIAVARLDEQSLSEQALARLDRTFSARSPIARRAIDLSDAGHL